MRAGLAAGTDLWLNTDTELWKLSKDDMNDTVVTNMQRAAKNIVFAVSRSNAMNGLSSRSKIVKIIPVWQIAVYAASGILTLLALAGAVLATINKKNSRKKQIWSAVLAGICAVLLLGGGVAVCLVAGEDYLNLGIPLGVAGIILCVANILVNRKDEPKENQN